MRKLSEEAIRQADHIPTDKVREDLKELFAFTIILRAELGGVVDRYPNTPSVLLAKYTLLDAEQTLDSLQQILDYRKEHNY